MNRDVCEHFNPVDLPCDKCKREAMNRDDIIRMAREAGLTHMPGWVESGWGYDNLERFAALVAAAEREACAKLAEETVCDTHLPTGVNIYGSRAAKAIRARSNP